MPRLFPFRWGRSEDQSRSSSSSSRPFLEIQYHPGDIRKNVRYIFLSRRRYVQWMVGILVWALLIFNGMRLFPEVFRDYAAKLEYRTEAAEKERLGESLSQRLERLKALERSTDEVRVEMSKIYMAYGFSEDESRGKGGYPYEPEKVPSSSFASEIRTGNGLRARIAEQFAVLETFLDEVHDFEQAHQDQVLTTPSITPVRSEEFVMTSPFGNRTSPFTKQLDFHAGIDLAAPIGTPIYAPADGVVAFAGRYPLKQSVGWWRYGNLVAIRHGERFITLYGHCDEVKVRGGQKVKQGELIATVGDTGWSTNPHLHYEVRRQLDDSFAPVDPRIYMLDHTWTDQEQILIRARRAPDSSEFEPLPRVLRR